MLLEIWTNKDFSKSSILMDRNDEILLNYVSVCGFSYTNLDHTTDGPGYYNPSLAVLPRKSLESIVNFAQSVGYVVSVREATSVEIRQRVIPESRLKRHRLFMEDVQGED